MVARRRREQRILLDEHGAPIMRGIGVATEAEMAAFWGPNWKAELAAAHAERGAEPGEVYDTLDEFFASLDNDHDQE
jgi:hypothetical protein